MCLSRNNVTDLCTFFLSKKSKRDVGPWYSLFQEIEKET